jgi:hypothetical protein
MKNRTILLATFLVLLSLLFVSCVSQKSNIDSAKIGGATPDSEPTTLKPTAINTSTGTSIPDVPHANTVFLPNLYNNTIPTPEASQPVAQSENLPPERWQEWPVIPVISEHAKEIYRAGIAEGHDPTHFSKVGDCQNIRQYFLGMFDDPTTYRLGADYEYLTETINYFAGNWVRASEAVRTGFNVASVLSPLHANPDDCQAAETPLDCEFRIWNPSFVIISMETWTKDRPTQAYEDYLRQIVDYAIAHNVLPIVATKADNLEGDNSINQIVANVAADYDIPMWNFWAAAHPLTDNGLMEDGFHLTNGPNFFDDPQSMDLAWPVRNLTGLLLVDAVWKAVR